MVVYYQAIIDEMKKLKQDDSIKRNEFQNAIKKALDATEVVDSKKKSKYDENFKKMLLGDLGRCSWGISTPGGRNEKEAQYNELKHKVEEILTAAKKAMAEAEQSNKATPVRGRRDALLARPSVPGSKVSAATPPIVSKTTPPPPPENSNLLDAAFAAPLTGGHNPFEEPKNSDEPSNIHIVIPLSEEALKLKPKSPSTSENSVVTIHQAPQLEQANVSPKAPPPPLSSVPPPPPRSASTGASTSQPPSTPPEGMVFPAKPNKPKPLDIPVVDAADAISDPTHEATFLAAAGDLDLKRLEIYQRAEAERRKQQLLKSKENEISSFARNYEARMTEIKPLNFKLNKAEIGLINDYTSKFRDLEYKRIKLAEFVPLVEEDLKQINKKSPLWGIMNDMCNQGKALLTAPVATSEIVMPLKKPLKGRNDPPVVPTPRISTSTTSSVSVPPSVLTTTNSPPYLPMAQHTATSATPTKIQTLPPRSEEQRQILNCIAPITMSILNYNQSRKKSRFGKSNKRKKQIEAIQSALNTLSLHLHISDPSKEIKTDIVYTNAIKKIQEVHDEIKKEKRYSGEASSTLQDIAQRFLTEVEGGAFKAPEKKHSKPKK